MDWVVLTDTQDITFSKPSDLNPGLIQKWIPGIPFTLGSQSNSLMELTIQRIKDRWQVGFQPLGRGVDRMDMHWELGRVPRKLSLFRNMYHSPVVWSSLMAVAAALKIRLHLTSSCDAYLHGCPEIEKDTLFSGCIEYFLFVTGLCHQYRYSWPVCSIYQHFNIFYDWVIFLLYRYTTVYLFIHLLKVTWAVSIIWLLCLVLL